MPLYYISFATDAGFLGATVVSATSAAFAIDEATKRGLNPGGQAAVIRVPEGMEAATDITPLLNRLVTKDELVSRGGKSRREMTVDEVGMINERVVHVDCNK